MREIFVFGSNTAGLHYGGSAKHAYECHGAEWGNGFGPQGESYAIPTLDGEFKKLPLEMIQNEVEIFKTWASLYPDDVFNVVAIGCGIAGFTPDDIAPMFAGCTPNVRLPLEFKGH